MRKKTEIAVSALISLVVAVPASNADTNKKSVAMAPYAIPHMMPTGTRGTVVSAAQRRQTIQTMVRSSYPSGHYQRGMNFHQRGDDDRALIEFLKAAQENPLQVRAFYEQALIFKKKGYLKLAQSALQQALAVKPDYREARVLLASTYLDGGDLSHAAGELVASLGLNIGRPVIAGGNHLQSGEPHLAPPRSASVIQTPHGMLSESPSLPGSVLNHMVNSPANSVAASKDGQPVGADAFVRDASAGAVFGDNVPARAEAVVASAGRPANAFSDKDSRNDSDDLSVNELLRGVPGANGSKADEEPAVAAESVLPLGVKSAIEQTVNGAMATGRADNPARQMQELLKHAGTEGADAGKGFRWPNIFGFFGGDNENKPVRIAENPQMRKLEEKTISVTQQQRQRKKRMTSWLDHVLDGSHADMQKDLSALDRTANLQIVHDDGSVEQKNDVNPIEILARASRDKPSQSAADDVKSTLPETANQPLPIPKAVESANESTDPLQSVVKLVEDQLASVQKSAAGIVNALTGDKSSPQAVSSVDLLGQPDSLKTSPEQGIVAPAVPVSDSLAKAAQNTEQEQKIGTASAAYQNDPLAVRTVEFSHKIALSTAADSAKEAKLPIPADISKFVKRALSWVPMPILKPESAASATPVLPSPLPMPAGNTVSPSLPLPVLAALKQSRGQFSPELPVNLSRASIQPAPLLPVPALDRSALAALPALSGLPAVPTVISSASPKATGLAATAPSMDGLRNVLPKDVVATIEQMLSPKPVDIGTAKISCPPLQNVRLKTADSQVGPAPVVSSSSNVYQQLVTARLGSPAQEAGVAMPTPIKPNTAGRLSNELAPAPIPSRAQSSNITVFIPPTPTIGRAELSRAPLPVPMPKYKLAGADSENSAPLPFVSASNRSDAVNNMALAQPPAPYAGSSGASYRPAPLPIVASANANFGPLRTSRSDLPSQTIAPNAYAGTPAPVPMDVSLPASGHAPNVVPIRSAVATVSSAPGPIAAQEFGRYLPMVGASVTNKPVVEQADTVVNRPGAFAQEVGAASMAASKPQINAVQTRVARLSGQGFRFVAPTLSPGQQYLVNTIKSTKLANRQVQSAKSEPVKPAAPPEDEWAKKMKYLLANGTQSLSRGEAFMFSEESGEGVLFLAGGNTIRRKIAESQDAEQVARLRRPDILKPQGDLQYNLSLLGKIIKPTNTPTQSAPESTFDSGLSVNEMLGKSDGFLGWLKGVFKF